jgi:hypothetical protein
MNAFNISMAALRFRSHMPTSPRRAVCLVILSFIATHVFWVQVSCPPNLRSRCLCPKTIIGKLKDLLSGLEATSDAVSLSQEYTFSLEPPTWKAMRPVPGFKENMGQSTSLCRFAIPTSFLFTLSSLMMNNHMHDIECPTGTMHIHSSSDFTRLQSSSSLDFVLEEADNLQFCFFFFEAIR